jgi:hypothetical protein
LPLIPAVSIRHLVQTFFNGSAEQAVVALIDTSTTRLSADELDRLSGLIERARDGTNRPERGGMRLAAGIIVKSPILLGSANPEIRVGSIAR